MLGIDTGGTSTDAVVVTGTDHPVVVATAKAPTTHHDLSNGIAQAAAGACSGLPTGTISLVSISTTLATNAIVEGRGGSVGLITMGFDTDDLARTGIDEVLGSSGFHLSIPGGHSSHGDELAALDLAELDRQLGGVAVDRLGGIALASVFATRHPAHEQAVRTHLRTRYDVGVTCSHELSDQLNGPKRALTAVLNARLLHLIGDLVTATRTTMTGLGIDAPLMVVRGDGSLMTAEMAVERPVETVLSGPAASIIGAAHIAEAAAGTTTVVADIGGTTTDLAVAVDGRVPLDERGASVGGHTTMVPAVAVHTVGLGGDSEVRIADDGPSTLLRVGPSRVVPLVSLASTHPEIVDELRRQRLVVEQSGRAPRLSGSFAVTRSMPTDASGFDDHRRAILTAVDDGPVPLRNLLPTRRHEAAAEDLMTAGVLDRAAFTPTDAAHVLGLDHRFDREAARLGAELLAATHDRRGDPVGASPDEVAQAVLDAVVEQSSSAILDLVLDRDGLTAGSNDPTITAGLDRHRGLVDIDVRLAAPIVPLGASAALHHPGVARRLGTSLVTSPHAEVANAIGAVVGMVRQSKTVTIAYKKHRGYVVDGDVFDDLDEAAAAAIELATGVVRELAVAAGAESPSVEVERRDVVVDADGARVFVESVITAEATGRPRRRGSASS